MSEAPPLPQMITKDLIEDCYTCDKCSSNIELVSLNKEKKTIKFKCLNKKCHGIKEMNIQDYLKEMKKNTYLYYKCSTCAKIQKDKINISNYFNYCLKCEKIYCDKCFGLHLNNNNMDKKMHKEIKINELNTHCVEHSIKNKNTYVSYCFDCKEHLCKVCLKSRIHINHKKNSIIEIQPMDEELLIIRELIKENNNKIENLINEQTTKLNELKEKLNNNISSIKDKYQNEISQNEIKEENELYINNKIYLSDIDKLKKQYYEIIEARNKKLEKENNDIKTKYIKLKEEKNRELQSEIEILNQKFKENQSKLNYGNEIDKIKNINKISEIIYNTYDKYNDNYIYSININNLILNYCKNNYIKNVVMKNILKDQFDDVMKTIFQKENENKELNLNDNENYLKEIINYANNKNENKHEAKNRMTIIYDTKHLKEVKLFDSEFIEKNKNKCYLIINKKERQLCQFIYEEDYKNERFLEVLLIEKEKIIDMGNMFNGCTSLFSLPDINKWDTTGVTNFDSLFFNCSSLTILPDILKFNTSNITNMKGLFYNCSSLTVLPDISSWDTSNVTNMGWLFCGCVKLVSLPDISKWDTSKVINMQNMFSRCESIKSLPDLSHWDTSNVKNMGFIFSRCVSLSKFFDISKWVINDFQSKKNMFKGCENIIIKDIPKDFFE